LCGLPDLHLLYNGGFFMGLRSSPLAYTILPSSAGGLGLFQSGVACPLSHFETDCLETSSFSASCSCVRSLAFRSVKSFSEKFILFFLLVFDT
jgi:hypothetical protein